MILTYMIKMYECMYAWKIYESNHLCLDMLQYDLSHYTNSFSVIVTNLLFQIICSFSYCYHSLILFNIPMIDIFSELFIIRKPYYVFCIIKSQLLSFPNIIWYCNDRRLFTRLSYGKLSSNVVYCISDTWNKLYLVQDQNLMLPVEINHD